MLYAVALLNLINNIASTIQNRAHLPTFQFYQLLAKTSSHQTETTNYKYTKMYRTTRKLTHKLAH